MPGSRTGANSPRRCTPATGSQTSARARHSSLLSQKRLRPPATQPDLKITRGVVDVSLCTREDGLWVTQKDIDMAEKISAIARRKGLTPEPAAVTQLELALDTANQARLAPFSALLLTGTPANNIYDSR